MTSPKVSIIIALYQETPEFYDAVAKCLALDYSNFEILIGVDHGIKLNFTSPKIKVIHTGLTRTGPAEKRDIGILKSRADYIAFLDDDSFPRADWLTQAMAQFTTHPDISALGGPGLTPPGNTFAQKITGGILSTYWGTGPYTYRFTQKASRLVDDYPAYNLIVRRSTLVAVGGFDNKFYGGEDTALCIKLINAGYKILYHPDLVVYHHRRAFPSGYLKQVGNVGLHRGYFAKAYSQTSLRPSYFMPLLGIILTLTFTIFAFFVPSLRPAVVTAGLVLYFAGILDAIRTNSLAVSLVLPACIYLAHASYAYWFVRGLLTSHLDR